MSAGEIVIKADLGRLRGPCLDAWAEILRAEVTRSRFLVLPVTMEHTGAVGSLPTPHNDPFDNARMAAYPVSVVWWWPRVRGKGTGRPAEGAPRLIVSVADLSDERHLGLAHLLRERGRVVRHERPELCHGGIGFIAERVEHRVALGGRP